MHLIQKHRFDIPSESGDQDYNKSVSKPVKLVKQRPNEELHRAKKQPPLFLIQHVSGAKLSKDNEKKEWVEVKTFPGVTTNCLKHQTKHPEKALRICDSLGH